MGLDRDLDRDLDGNADKDLDAADLLVLYGDPGAGVRASSQSGISWRRWGSVEPDVSATLVIGAFDGMHTGHRSLVSWACEDAATRAEPVVAVTFTPTPKEFFNTQGMRRRLLDDADRVAALLAAGVDGVIAFDFTPELAALSTEAFVDEVLLAVQATSVVHVGENFTFGSKRSGNARDLDALGADRGFTCVAHGLVEVAVEAVSSTRIRVLLDEGQVGNAAQLLGRYHFVRGSVVHGRGEGTGFGFATANVEVRSHDMLPAEGVYACYVEVSGVCWPAAANVGAPRTFEGDEAGTGVHRAFLEAHLLGFDGNLYGCDVSVHFVEWLRAQQTFDTLDELKQTVTGNIDWVREHLGDAGVRISS